MKLKLLLLVGATLTLVGCASNPINHRFFHTNKQAYLTSQSTPPISIPSGLSGSKIDSYYDIPNVPGDVNGPISLLPPGSLAAQQSK